MISSWDLWAKTPRAAEDSEAWHTLPRHLLEVGAVAEAMWDTFLPVTIQARLRERWQMTDEEARRWVGFLAAVHDIGKASLRFQSMSEKQISRLQGIYPGLKKDTSNNTLRHSLISLGLLDSLFQSEFGWDYRIAARYAEITAAHHGKFWTIDNIYSLESNTTRVRIGIPAWDATHRQIFGELARAFAISESMIDRLNADGTHAPSFPTYDLSLWLTGLISVADWIGSDERHFPMCSDKADSYSAGLKSARIAAKSALVYTGWASPPLPIPAGSMKDTIIAIKDFDPNIAQQAAEELVRSMASPGMIVIEIPTGSGKTEIAIWIAAYLAEEAGVHGFYFALPTMATSDQMYDRIYKHLKKHAEQSGRERIVPLHLLHGMSEFSVMEEASEDDPLTELAMMLTKLNDPDQDRDIREVQDKSNVVRRAQWFTPKKRGLLAQYGVGTVDQALMSVLYTPHFFVRMFGLAGKTVVFDEAHAYDTYMGTLFDQLLRFLGALGSPVVILSATLPRQRTEELLAAYADGANWTPKPKEIAAYPRISAVDAESYHSVSVKSKKDATTIALEWLPSAPESMWQRLAERLVAELHEDGNVAVICNTVVAAQACFQELSQHFHPDELTLFHSRYRRKDRRTIQESTPARFGKDAGDEGNPPRPLKHIVVATQVIEQSLDLDFDHMVSMFCPIDLLLQRAGRLQRHEKWNKQRPASFRTGPRLWLIGFDMDDPDAAPVFDKFSTRVYFEYFLLRSWIALNQHTSIDVPGDVEILIENTYGEQSTAPDSFASRLDDLKQRWQKEVQTDETTARSVLIQGLRPERIDNGTDVLVEFEGIREEPENNPEAHKSRLALTRLGDPTVMLVVLTSDDIHELGRDPLVEDVEELKLSEVRWFLERSVSVSNGAIVRCAETLPTPRSWEDSAHLRFHKLIVLNENHEMAFENGYTLQWDANLGIVITKEENE